MQETGMVIAINIWIFFLFSRKTDCTFRIASNYFHKRKNKFGENVQAKHRYLSFQPTEIFIPRSFFTGELNFSWLPTG